MREAADECFSYERLRVWQKAVEFAGTIYTVTRSFPREELFGLTNQLRRAGVSIAANIAEGVSRTSGKDQSRFFEIAFGSLNEVATMLYIAQGQGFINDDQFSLIRSEIADIGRMLSGLRRTALNRKT